MITNFHQPHLKQHQPTLRHSIPLRTVRLIVIFLQVLVAWRFSVIGLWPLALLIVLVLELRDHFRRLRIASLVRTTPQLIAGASAILTIAVYPRMLSQIVVGLAYLGWRIWLEQYTKRAADRNVKKSTGKR